MINMGWELPFTADNQEIIQDPTPTDTPVPLHIPDEAC